MPKGVSIGLAGLSLMAVLVLVGSSYSLVTVTGDWEIVDLPSPIPDCVPDDYPLDEVVKYTYTMIWNGEGKAPSYWAIGLPAICNGENDPWAVFCITSDPGNHEYPAGNLPHCQEDPSLLYIKIDELPDNPLSDQTYTLSFYSYYLPIEAGAWLVKGGQSCENGGSLPVPSCDVPVAIELSSFTATAGDGKVILNWTTQSETENLGFNIYRSQAEDGDYIKINSQIIPGTPGGSSQTGRDYSYVDDGLTNGVTYYYKLDDVDFQGNKKMHGPVFVALYAEALASSGYALLQNYPNPFNPETGIRYQIARDGQVTLRIYNVVGQPVRTLVDRTQAAGSYTVYWDGKDDTGKAVGDGVYLYSLKANGYMATKKMLLVR